MSISPTVGSAPRRVRGVTRPHIVMVIPRGEALRNFVYSETLRNLTARARVTLLSVVNEQDVAHHAPGVEAVRNLEHYPPHSAVSYLRGLIDMAHFRYLETDIGGEMWARALPEAKSSTEKVKKLSLKALAWPLSNDPSLRALSRVEAWLHRQLRPTDEFIRLFRDIQPDLVFNGSHIHGPAAEEPMRAARDLGIPTAGFIFSWDNLYSRGRILTPYDHFLVWNDLMKRELLRFYPHTPPSRVHITGTPQFDYHFHREFWLDREELSRRTGIDSGKPFILYTTGVDRHFPEEHLHVENVIRMLDHLSPKPQLVVRTYVKGTSRAMRAIADRNIPGVIFPPVLWDEKWYTPRYEDQAIYTSMLRHCGMGINVASTVSLELLMHDKPVLNLGFNPPGSNLAPFQYFSRHIHFDHYRPVAASGATMVAWSVEDVKAFLIRGMQDPAADSEKRQTFIRQFFGKTLDGHSGARVAETLLRLSADRKQAVQSVA